MSERALVRRRDTSAQVEMTSEEARHANMADALEAAAGVDIADQAVVLVDNVQTTGSTLHSAAAAHKEAGAALVHALVYARDVLRCARNVGVPRRPAPAGSGRPRFDAEGTSSYTKRTP